MTESEVFGASYLFALLAILTVAFCIGELVFKIIYRKSRLFRRWFNRFYNTLPMSDRRW